VTAMDGAVYWLAATAALTGLMWIPYLADRIVRLGPRRTLGNPARGDEEALAPWAQRAHRAHRNAVENLVVFAALVVAAALAGRGDTPLVAAAARVYFLARLAHFAVYVAGVPLIRTLAFATGFFAQAAIAFAVLSGGGS